MSVQRVLYRTKHRIGRGPNYFGGTYESAQQIGNYKVQKDEDEKYIHFLLLNPDKPCIVMYIEKSSTVAVMSSLDYSASCTVDGNMKRGDGTRKMVEFAIALAKDHGATKMELQDESTIYCDESRAKVKLGPFSFLRQGKTWYEKYFGFLPTPEFHEEYEHAKELRKKLDIEMLHSQPCNYFDRHTINALLRKVELDFYSMVWEKTL
jgi:hypothetical protein